MKKASTGSFFRRGEFQLRYFVLSIPEGTFRYTETDAEARKKDAGKLYTHKDLFKVLGDHSEGGRQIDFSGERAYPFPFTLFLQKRELVLASRSRDDREMWVNAFKLLVESKKA